MVPRAYQKKLAGYAPAEVTDCLELIDRWLKQMAPTYFVFSSASELYNNAFLHIMMD